jgi:hypothetical protein
MKGNKTRHFVSFALATAFVAAIVAFSGCTSLLGSFEVSEATGEGGTGNANGTACQLGSECASTFCADGVCCESACSGTCESCGLAEKGKCAPVPSGQDPQKECLPAPRPDAGPAAPELDAGATDGGEAEDAAGTINFPDSGFVSADDKCAGSCNGERACKFPSTETTCGTKFCNTPTEAARFSCDGKGRCELGVEQCKSFACENEECRVTCAAQDDCLSTHFCNSQGKCQQKLANGVNCNTPNDCTSDACVEGVCCNTACGDIPGATCKKAGSVGKCTCSRDCGTGACVLWYRDGDTDGFGDRLGTLATNTAMIGCTNLTPVAGFVANKADCADNDPRAFPGATAYYETPITGTTSFDFNCNGTLEKLTPEYPGASCVFCGAPKTCPSSTTCSTAGQGSRLSCKLGTGLLCPIGQACYVCGGNGRTNYNTGFTSTVACGAVATSTTCGKCTLKSGAPSATTAQVQQRCH